MIRHLLVVAIFLLTLTFPGNARAGLLLSLSAPGVNLNNLHVGDHVGFQVSLSGLHSGDALGFLDATVKFDSTLLGMASIKPGGILPPDGVGFAGSTFPDSVDGNYDSLFSTSGDQVTSNGVFYTFDLTVLKAGSGTVGFTHADSLGTDSGGSPLDPVMSGGDLSYRASDTTAVPEPGSGVILLTGLATLVGWRQLRRKQSCPASGSSLNKNFSEPARFSDIRRAELEQTGEVHSS